MSSAFPNQVLVGSSNGTPVPSSPSKPPTVCVFCGASAGTSPAHLAAARDLGRALHENGMNLVYGGGTAGMMGEVAKTLVSLSGPDSVHGIIPEPLLRFERKFNENGVEQSEEAAARVIDERLFGKTTVVNDMHTRKHMMAREVIEGGAGGGFVALTGGYGTLEELMEMTTWNQLGIHERPIVIFNVEGYYDGIMQWVNNAIKTGFVSESNRNIMIEAKEAGEVIDCLRQYKNSKGRLNLRWGQK